MKYTKHQSKAIAETGYDEPTQKMHIRFTSGSEYAYPDVPPAEYDAFVNADSIGAHFHRHIRPNFQGERV